MRALIISLLAALAFAETAGAAGTVRVLTTGLGGGRVKANTPFIPIDCGPGVATGCTVTNSSQFPPLYADLIPTADGNSKFVGWHGDCSGTGQCRVFTSGFYSVRAEFATFLPINPLTTADINPTAIAAYLAPGANDHVTDAARFLSALPVEYKQGWILMTRSESLQTGTARFPRVMLPSTDARNVLTLGLASHAAYPGADPNAIEYMQWDASQKNFRFHEIVLATIPKVEVTRPDGTKYESFPERHRGVSVDEPRCTRCHSTRNIAYTSTTDRGTTGWPPGVVKAKNKPNWDSYDSWGGAMPFNRDRIYQGSLEAAAFRKLFNPWTYAADAKARQIMEQLQLPESAPTPTQDRITRLQGAEYDGKVVFPFDSSPFVTIEPLPVGQAETTFTNSGQRNEPATAAQNYSFNNIPGSGPATVVQRSGPRVTLHEVLTPTSDEGRAVQLFDRLGGLDSVFNQTRVGDELANHQFATGSVPMDVRPIVLAINRGCLRIDAPTNRLAPSSLVSGGISLTFDQNFFRYRNNNFGINEILADSNKRTLDMPRRKADIQKFNLDRNSDPYFTGANVLTDLLSEYGSGTAGGSGSTLTRLRQEIFRRNIDAGDPDQSIMGNNLSVDREIHGSNNDRVAQFRFLLEPLGVSVDKWSMSVRGRSRTYTFADIFSTYIGPITNEIVASLSTRPYAGAVALNPFDCNSLVNATNEVLASPLPGLDAMPPYTDIQRIFNKGCIECHGGLNYPPFSAFQNINLDLSEEDGPASGNRLERSHGRAMAFTTSALNTSRIWVRIDQTSEACPGGMMPCGGPALSQADVHTIKRWIIGGRTDSLGDPHLTTMDGTHYDFQSAGEFTMLRDESFELQMRQSPVQADGPLPPDAHSGLASCPSINTAAAVRVGPHRITYQPDPYGNANPNGLQLRVDGALVEKLDARGYALSAGGRILPTTGGGIQIEYPGGTDVVITPGFWDYYQLWYLNVDVRRSRAIFGVMGQIQPRNWLPALPDGSTFGERPANTSDRYQQLYGKFADAWRVKKTTTLFDYAPGTSSATYTLKGWPLDGAKTCNLPAGWAPKQPPQKPLNADVAKEVCNAVVDKTRRANCIADVMATGEIGFAKTYLASEQIQRNYVPGAPSLVAPMVDALDLSDAVDFAWEPTYDKDGGKLTYLHCVWPVGDTQTFKQCKPVSAKETKTYVTGLEPNRAYYWKLVVDDGQGGTVESETRRFKTK